MQDFNEHLLPSTSGVFYEVRERLRGNKIAQCRALHIGTTDAYKQLSTEEVRLGYVRYMENSRKASGKAQ
jgi:hypothetical protein